MWRKSPDPVPMIFIRRRNRVIEIQAVIVCAPIKLTVPRPPAPCLCLEAKAAILIPGFPSLLPDPPDRF